MHTVDGPWTRPRNYTRYYFQGCFAKWRTMIGADCRQSLDKETGMENMEQVSMDTIGLTELTNIEQWCKSI